jgi:hypothetical protein
MTVRLDDEKDLSGILNLGGGKGDFLKLGEGHNFILILDVEGAAGYEHWVKIGENTYRRTCSGGLEGGGWAVDECGLCALAQEQYDLKKEAKNDGDDDLADSYNKKGNGLRAQYSLVLPGVQFKGIAIKVKDKKTGKSKKKFVPDLDEEYKIGKLRLTQAQAKKLASFIKEGPDQIQSGSDLTKYILDLVKKKEGDKKYAELSEIKLSKSVKDLDIEIDEDQYPSIDDEFKESNDIDKIVKLYTQGSEHSEEYEEENLFKDKKHAYDDEEDEDEEKPKKKKSRVKEEEDGEEEDDYKPKKKESPKNKKKATKRQVEEDEEF